jgi:hypothetical protein
VVGWSSSHLAARHPRHHRRVSAPEATVVASRIGPAEIAEAALAASALLHSLRWAGVAVAIPAPPEVPLAVIALRTWADDLKTLAAVERRPPA